MSLNLVHEQVSGGHRGVPSVIPEGAGAGLSSEQRQAATISYSLVTVLAIAVCASALLSHRRVAGAMAAREESRRGRRASSPGCAGPLPGCALVALTRRVSGRRWHHGPSGAAAVRGCCPCEGCLPDAWVSQLARRARRMPASAKAVEPSVEGCRPPRLRRVTAAVDVVAGRPARSSISGRLKTSRRRAGAGCGAWREFGYVYLLRSAASVTPAEYRQFKRSRGNFAGLLIESEEQFATELAGPLPTPAANAGTSSTSPARKRFGS